MRNPRPIPPHTPGWNADDVKRAIEMPAPPLLPQTDPTPTPTPREVLAKWLTVAARHAVTRSAVFAEPMPYDETGEHVIDCEREILAALAATGDTPLSAEDLQRILNSLCDDDDTDDGKPTSREIGSELVRAYTTLAAQLAAVRAELERVVVEVEPKDAGQGLGGSAAEVVRGAMYELDLWRSEGKALRAERDALREALRGLCFCGELAAVDQPCAACQAKRTATPARPTLLDTPVRTDESMPVDEMRLMSDTDAVRIEGLARPTEVLHPERYPTSVVPCSFVRDGRRCNLPPGHEGEHRFSPTEAS